MNIFKKLPQKNINKDSHKSSSDDSYQTIVFPNEHSAQLISVSADAEPEQVIFKLPLTTPKPLIMISGDTEGLDEETQHRLIQLCSRGITRTAVNMQAVIMDDGKDSGLVNIIGKSVANWRYKSPLIGITSTDQVTYPELPSNSENESALEPNHTHFILVNTKDNTREIEFRHRVGVAMTKNMPAVAILINGACSLS